MTLETLLAASGISPAFAARAGVRVVSNDEARSLGFVAPADVNLAGVLFPYPDPRRPGRTFNPELRPFITSNGCKYLSMPASVSHFYLPTAIPEHLSDPRFDCYVTEGARKALALAEVVGASALVVGLRGVWNWRTSDKVTQPTADHPGQERVRVNSRAIEDFDGITWKGRRVYLHFDSDAAKNLDVQRAEQALVAELRKRGADVFIVSLPPASTGVKQGIDDWLVALAPANRPAALRRLLQAAAPRRKLKPDEQTALDLVYEPAGGFMRAFDEFADAATDAPGIYRPFAALAVLAALAGRNVTADFGPFPLGLNLNVVLLAPSSYFHKTTMITLAKRVVGAIDPARLYPDDSTPERFLELLQKQPAGLLACPEFAGFLARSTRDYNAGSRELWMELYDVPETFRRETKSGSILIERPTLSIFGASALSWLTETMKGGDLRSGFFNRIAFVLAESKSKSYALPMRPERRLWDAVTHHAKRVAERQGEMSFRRCERAYAAWYRDVEREAVRADANLEALSAFYTRLSVSALKIAALLELAQSDTLEVSESALGEALVLTDYLRAVIRHLLKVEFAASDETKRASRVLAVISKAPGCTRKVLLQQTGYDARRLTDALETLTQRGDVYVQDGRHWPAG